MAVTAHQQEDLVTYRAVCRHVRYWRGVVHHWSTVYQFVGTPSAGITLTDAQQVLAIDNAMLYGTGPNAGGTYECAIYDQASGGVPLVTYTAFNPAAPASWLVGPGTAWPTTAAGLEKQAEVALQVTWAAGLSHSGKPVHLRKWYHMVPVASSTGGSADVLPAAVTALQAEAQAMNGVLGGKGLTLGTSSGRIAGLASVLPFYGNHQMPRGRRRKVSSSSAKSEANYGAILKIINGEAAD
jgi:hypothetical protein